ncbi:MAG TPA: hypothetical protein PKI03_27345 [Pseudomonadota bacterium]|nr:hypothetical protein [Pseudomonadota bacterium]
MTLLAAPDGARPGSVLAELAFASEADVSLDTTRPGGVLRAKTHPSDGYGSNVLATHACRIDDLAAGAVMPGLEATGFDRVDISGFGALQRVLARVRQAGTMTEADAQEIRRCVMGRSVRLSDGKKLRFLFVAPEGIILRKAGPNGIAVDADEPRTRTSGHGAATAVHGDQDVRGTPIRQILRGLGPWIFRHDAPDGSNRWSPVFLLNLWIPLQQITRPLALMDERTLDRRRHQLRYALPTESFLDRSPDRRLNDIWMFLPDPGQRWYFSSEMDSQRAYVFNTLTVPHGSFILPGEDIACRLYVRLRDAKDAVSRGDRAALAEAVGEKLDSTAHVATAPLRRAIDAMDALLSEARETEWAALLVAGEAFRARADAALDRVVRRSIELRAVALMSSS